MNPGQTFDGANGTMRLDNNDTVVRSGKSPFKGGVNNTGDVNDTIGGMVAAMERETNDRSENGDGHDYMDERMLRGSNKQKNQNGQTVKITSYMDPSANNADLNTSRARK